MYSVTDVRQMEMHTARPLVPEPSSTEIEIVIEKLKIYISPGRTDPSRRWYTCSEIQRLLSSIWSKGGQLQQWKVSITVPIYTKGGKTDCSNYRGISLFLVSSHIQNLSNSFLSSLTPYVDGITDIIRVDFGSNFLLRMVWNNEIFFTIVAFQFYLRISC